MVMLRRNGGRVVSRGAIMMISGVWWQKSFFSIVMIYKSVLKWKSYFKKIKVHNVTCFWIIWKGLIDAWHISRIFNFQKRKERTQTLNWEKFKKYCCYFEEINKKCHGVGSLRSFLCSESPVVNASCLGL